MRPSLPPLSPFHRRALLLVLVWAAVVRVLFALHDPGPGRFFDERYGFANLHALLVEGSWRPANGWYGTLAHLPQAAVLAVADTLARWTGQPALEVLEGGRFNATAYLLCRWTVVLYGLLTLLLIHRLGRRLASPAVALTAVFLLAISPAHLRASVMFKPDMLMLLGVLAAFLLTLEIVSPSTSSRPRRLLRYHRDGLRFGALGATVGLTAAAKLLGALAGLPLVLAPALPRRLLPGPSRGPGGGQARGRLLVGGCLALVVGVGVFLMVNPFLGLHWEHLQRNSEIYRERARLEGLTRGRALLSSLGTLLGEGFHGPGIGPLVGVVALLGLLALLALAVRGRPAPGAGGARPDRLRGTEPRAAFLVVTFVVAFTGFYALATAYPKPNNLLPVLPFTCLAAAWLLVTGGRAVARLGPAWNAGFRYQPGGRVGIAALVLLAVLASAPFHHWAYRTVVPTTAQQVTRWLEGELTPFAGRALAWEVDTPPPYLVNRRGAVAVLQGRRAGGAHPRALLRRLDARVLPAARAVSPLPGSRIHRVAPAPGRLRGPSLEVHLQPWRRVGHHRMWWEGATSARGGNGESESLRWRLRPPPEPPSEVSPTAPAAAPWWSVQILWRDREPPPVTPVLRIEPPGELGRPEALLVSEIETGGYHYGWAYTSLRFQPPAGSSVVVELPAPGTARPPVADVALWSR